MAAPAPALPAPALPAPALPAPAPGAAAALAAGIAALQGFQVLGIVTQADLAPLATQAQLQAVQAALQAQQAALQAQLGAMQVHLMQQMQALLAPVNVPVIAAAVVTIVQAIAAARAQNAHDRSNEPYAVVPRADGTLPPSWPAGFDRAGLRGPTAAVNALLGDYNLAVPHGASARRDALALHIGTMRLS
jgi:hypothetical protein